ncbi:MAG: S8 family serine peptidase [Caldilineaceae bacterium]|nr:S8 family serine peptidase [Caldilineaceae bacterium]
MNKVKYLGIALTVLALTLLLGSVAFAGGPVSDGPAPAAPASPRLIVELETPPLAVAHPDYIRAGSPNARSADAQNYISALQAEQAIFVSNLQAALPGAYVSTFTNEAGAAEPNAYQVVFNGMAIHPGSASSEDVMRVIARLPGVKGVYPDRAYATDLYTSTALINAPVVWDALGGRENAGAGVKVASVDGGVHHLAPMMDGTGYTYPDGYGPSGLGLTANNNGKIIASRVYFRDWDPPAPGDETPWPGASGTEHGMHTSSTAAGGIVDNATSAGLNVGRISGVAPKAYVMSYRVFYNSVNGIGSFYTAEGIAALEDIVLDGADVVNNSWGGGPGSEGGEFDPLDQALINAWNAGVFVSMSAGNAGPGNGTTDHPSPEYINVAASSTSGTLASGRVSTTISDTVKDAPFGIATFGAPLPIGQVLEYPYLPAIVANPANFEGCAPWPANTFTGKAALISRGVCEFGVKVLNAENAGATFVVIYNNPANGDTIGNMGPGAVGNQVTISSIQVGRTAGLGFLAHHAAVADARLQVSTVAFQAGNIADRIASFSSRGPGVGNVLKPDIAAPGVNILAQGYTPGATGEARHLGYGQASGTSMASPHVAGAAALVKQAYPTWPNWAVKSALMTTAKFMDIYNFNGTPAQPLDMGAGRLDLQNVLDPGVVLDPQSLSFGLVTTGTQKSIVVSVTSVGDMAETYTFSTIWTGAGFLPTQTTTVPGITIDPATLTINPGETKQFTVTFTAANGRGYNDNQGYVTLDGAEYDAHMAAWARVTYAAPMADVLIIDNDGSQAGFYDYSWYYTNTLTNLGMTYTVWPFTQAGGLPSLAEMLAYKAVLWYTGENYLAAQGLTTAQQNRMVDYLNSGGRLLAMGQDLAATIGAAPDDCSLFLYCSRLGSVYVQDSISDEDVPTNPIMAAHTAPAALRNMAVDLSAPRFFLDSGRLSGANEVPPVAGPAGGSFSINYNVDKATISYRVVVTTTAPVTVTAAHIHRGAVGVNGPVEPGWGLTPPGFTNTVVVSGTPLVLTGVIANVTAEQATTLLADGFYVNVHTTDNPSGAVRGQIEPGPYFGQVVYVDEIANWTSTDNPNPVPPGFADSTNSVPLFTYAGLDVDALGIVGMAKDDQPSLERPGTTYSGRAIYLTFGLEGINPPPPVPVPADRSADSTQASFVSREQLLLAAMGWFRATPGAAVISSTINVSSTGIVVFEGAYSALLPGQVAVQYRWDFGDGSPSVTSLSNEAGHQYFCSPAGNTYTVRVEVTDAFGMVALGSKQIDVSSTCVTEPETIQSLYLPVIEKD